MEVEEEDRREMPPPQSWWWSVDGGGKGGFHSHLLYIYIAITFTSFTRLVSFVYFISSVLPTCKKIRFCKHFRVKAQVNQMMKCVSV